MRIPLVLTPLALLVAAPAAHAQLAILDTQVNPANGHTYHLLDESSGSDAQAAAVALGGHLVTIDDAAEDSWVFATFGNYGGQGRDLWIGLNDVTVEGQHEWFTGTAVSYTNWAPFQPDNYLGNDPVNGEDYVHMYGFGSPYYPGQWNDIHDAAPGTATFTLGLYGVVEIAGLTLNYNGSCPGAGTVDLANGSAGALVFIAYAFATGPGVVPTGGCAGTPVDLLSPTLLTAVTLDANGAASLPVNVPGGACGNVWVQALAPATCEVTPVIAL